MLRLCAPLLGLLSVCAHPVPPLSPMAPCRFLLPSYFPLVLRAVASLEGVALSVDKNFKLISAGEAGQAEAAGRNSRCSTSCAAADVAAGLAWRTRHCSYSLWAAPVSQQAAARH